MEPASNDRRPGAGTLHGLALLGATLALLAPGLARAAAAGGAPEASAALPAIPTRSTTLPAGTWELAVRAGRAFPARDETIDVRLVPSLAVGLGDRWQLSLLLPELAYRFGEPDGTEVVASAGVVGVGYSAERGWVVVPEAALALRRTLAPGRSLLASAHAWAPVEWGVAGSRGVSEEWGLAGAIGLVESLGERVTLAPGLGVARSPDIGEGGGPGAALSIGTVLGVGGRMRPLVQVHLWPNLSLDGVASVGWHPATARWSKVVGAGLTWTF